MLFVAPTESELKTRAGRLAGRKKAAPVWKPPGAADRWQRKKGSPEVHQLQLLLEPVYACANVKMDLEQHSVSLVMLLYVKCDIERKIDSGTSEECQISASWTVIIPHFYLSSAPQPQNCCALQ